MKRWLESRNRWFTAGLFVTVFVLSALVVSFKAADADYFFKVNKSLDIFGRVYKEVTMNYVDELDPEKFMESGVDGLLGSLDPYTNFISESESDEIEMITTGTYGGIGVTIGLRDNYITIVSLMDGYSAQREGVQPGDRVVEIDGKNIVGMKPESVRSLTRGEPGSSLQLKVLREGESGTLSFTLMREEIHLRNVTYADFVGPGIAYVKLEHFSRTAGNEVRMAIQELRLRSAINGLILDLRDNPGGLLDAAVDVAQQFLPKGSLVVSTKGRRPESEKRYFSTEEPMLPTTPLVVLINQHSASASEIVAGAIQDLDRGVILGSRSFGKGLVQTITPLSYNTQLKITTAKYYTPSGRCIQEIDYLKRDTSGAFAVTADSLRHEFKTMAGRSVFERGGIMPDSLVPEVNQSSMTKELQKKLMYFRFATTYVSQHKNRKAPFTADPEVMRQFEEFLAREKFTYQEEGEKKALELAEIAEKGSYGKAVREEIVRLQKQIAAEKATALQRNYDEIRRQLASEISSRYGGEQGRIIADLRDDHQLDAARDILVRGQSYSELLTMRRPAAGNGR